MKKHNRSSTKISLNRLEMLISKQVTLHEEDLNLEDEVENNLSTLENYGTSKRSYTQGISRPTSTRLERIAACSRESDTPLLHRNTGNFDDMAGNRTSGLAHSHTSISPSDPSEKPS